MGSSPLTPAKKGPDAALKAPGDSLAQTFKAGNTGKANPRADKGAGQGPPPGATKLAGGSQSNGVEQSAGDGNRADGTGRRAHLIAKWRRLFGDLTSDEAERRGLKRHLDRIERRYRGHVIEGRRSGLNLAADFQERFLNSIGGKVIMSREQARGLKPIADAENRIKENFEESFQEKIFGKEHKFIKALKGVQDGQNPIQLEDYWDGENTMPGLLIRGEPDLALALGEHNLKGTGTFTITRKGDVILVSGPVNFLLEDTYDFKKGQPFADGALALKKHRGAEDFDFEARWAQSFQARAFQVLTEA